MNRIAVFQVGYEANTFAVGLAGIDDLGSGGWTPGEKVEELLSESCTDIGGILAGVKDAGCRRYLLT